jgi:hypothetical protein
MSNRSSARDQEKRPTQRPEEQRDNAADVVGILDSLIGNETWV